MRRPSECRPPGGREMHNRLPEIVDPQNVEPQNVDPQSADPQSTEWDARSNLLPETVEPQSVDPQNADSQKVGLQDPKSATLSVDPQGVPPRV